MGMERRASYDHYQRRHYVSQHALLHFREQLCERGETEHRNDHTLANEIDATLQIHLPRARRVLGRGGVLTWLVPLDSVAKDLVGVVQRDCEAPDRMVVVTVLTRSQVASSLAMGRLVDPEATPRTSLGAKLKARKPGRG